MKWRRRGKKAFVAYFRHSLRSIEENHEKFQVIRFHGRVLNRILPKCKLDALQSELVFLVSNIEYYDWIVSINTNFSQTVHGARTELCVLNRKVVQGWYCMGPQRT
jgi:hypothetical protein